MVLLSGLSGDVRAGMVTISVGTATFAAGGDTAAVAARTFTLDLTEGVPLTTALQTGTLTVGDSGALDMTFPFTLTRPATVGGLTLGLSQPGTLLISPTIDTLTLLDGATTSFDLGAVGILDVTPRSVTQSATALGTFPFTVDGTFLLRPAGGGVVPEPSTGMLGAIGTAGLLGYVLGRARRATR